MRDKEALHPRLARLSYEISGGEVKGGRRVGLAHSEFGCPRGSAVHPLDLGTPASSTTAAVTAIPALLAYASARCTICCAISAATGPTTALFCRKKLALASMDSACSGGTSTSLKIASTGQTISHCSQSMHTSGSM